MNDILLDCRNRIDTIDREIVRLLAERFDVVKEVAEYKKTSNMLVFQPSREDKILRQISDQLSGGGKEHEKYILEIYKTILDISKVAQS
jgi:monofunctional chorismate mutase